MPKFFTKKTSVVVGAESWERERERGKKVLLSLGFESVLTSLRVKERRVYVLYMMNWYTQSCLIDFSSLSITISVCFLVKRSEGLNLKLRSPDGPHWTPWFFIFWMSWSLISVLPESNAINVPRPRAFAIRPGYCLQSSFRLLSK